MHKRPFGIVSSLDAKAKSALYTKASLLRLSAGKWSARPNELSRSKCREAARAPKRAKVKCGLLSVVLALSRSCSFLLLANA